MSGHNANTIHSLASARSENALAATNSGATSPYTVSSMRWVSQLTFEGFGTLGCMDVQTHAIVTVSELQIILKMVRQWKRLSHSSGARLSSGGSCLLKVRNNGIP